MDGVDGVDGGVVVAATEAVAVLLGDEVGIGVRKIRIVVSGGRLQLTIAQIARHKLSRFVCFMP
jgi:small basic protein